MIHIVGSITKQQKGHKETSMFLAKNKQGKQFKVEGKESVKEMHKHRPRIYTDDPKTPAMHRMKKAALKASDNGRCWWVYDYIMRTTIRSKKEPLASHTGLAKELYPRVSKK